MSSKLLGHNVRRDRLVIPDINNEVIQGAGQFGQNDITWGQASLTKMTSFRGQASLAKMTSFRGHANSTAVPPAQKSKQS
jgi:hypothetical protein